MANAFEGLTPKVLWDLFKGITDTPRPSKHEGKIRDHLKKWGEAHGFATTVDPVGNLLISVPASPGREKDGTTVLQGHLDMVPEKNKNVEFDFLTQGIQVVRDGDWLKAAGTTLGADNGIGVAIACALATDPECSHPALELLFTVDEETGLTGAFKMGGGLLTGKRMINIDSEEEGVVYVGCAGGGDSELFFPLQLASPPDSMKFFEIRVRGLIGGHSGLTIHENRGNALKLLARVLHELAADKSSGLQILSLTGGDKHNAIPRESEATIAVQGAFASKVRPALDRVKAWFDQEYSSIEPKAALELDEAKSGKALSSGDSLRLIHLLLSLPHGVVSMSRDLPGLVETSTNLARVLWDGKQASILNSSRSSVMPALEAVRATIHAAAELSGATSAMKDAYPGWQPRMDSVLLKLTTEVLAREIGKAPKVTAIHAGLECGIIGEKYPGMDMVSVGPTMLDVHSPDEKLNISSTQRFYEFMKKLMAALN